MKMGKRLNPLCTRFGEKKEELEEKNFYKL